MAIGKVLNKMLEEKFKDLLRSGLFPEVQFKEESTMFSFSLIDFIDVQRVFLRMVHDYIRIDMGVNDGIHTLKRSKEFLALVQWYADNITPAMLRSRIDDNVYGYRKLSPADLVSE